MIGCSVLYHLAKQGWTDSLLVEQYQLTHGSTWHCGRARRAAPLVALADADDAVLGRALRRAEGADRATIPAGTSSAGCGSRRRRRGTRSSAARRRGRRRSGCRWRSSRRTRRRQLFPPMSTDGVVAAAFIPDDGYLDPSQLTFSLADAARRLGAQLEMRTTVTGDRDARRPRRRGGNGQGPRRVRGRRQRRRHVRAAGRAARRRRPADHPVRAPVPDHRAVQLRRSSRCRRCAIPTTSSTSARRWAGS